MLNDRQAEHIPGCNMAFYKWALTQIGGFDPIFHQAGDDVDICWRLQQAGHRIGFNPAGFVWHYRRSTIRAYLKQQHGYGEAEALLVRKHPECFNSLGGNLWHGRIYGTSKFGVLIRAPIIYRGRFGSAGYQSVYAADPPLTLMICTTLEYYVLVLLPLGVLATVFHQLLPLAVVGLLIPVGVCVAAGAQAALAKAKQRWWSRALVALLFFFQPIVRAWARYQGRLLVHPTLIAPQQSLDSLALRDSQQRLGEAQYWAEQPIDRLGWTGAILARLDQHGWPNKADIGWSEYDVEVYDTRWCRLQLTTVAEDHPESKQLIRCRLRARWALRTKVAFWLLCGLELLLCGLLAGRQPWLWLVLLTLPLFAYFIHRQQRNLQSIITILLDEIAREWNLTKITKT
jgi:hypothetical protein